jgi:hypothetical protein
VITARDIDPYPALREIPWPSCCGYPLSSPSTAAAHRSDHLSARAGTTTLTPGQPADTREIRALLRIAARSLASDANNDPVGGLPAVLDWRTELCHRTDLDTWATAGGHVWGLTATLAADSRRHTEPQRPQLHRNTDPPGPRPAPQRPTRRPWAGHRRARRPEPPSTCSSTR